MKQNILRSLFQKRMIVALFMGVASGLPLLLTSKTLQAWMTDEQVDLKVIGLFAMVGLPYTLKFVWAPVFDRFTLPFLGRRRGWLLISQILLALSIVAMAFSNPQASPWWLAFLALLVSFFSASQDIVVDAYRRETLADEELGLGSTLYMYGYRVAMWVSGALALILADHMPWKLVYLMMAGAIGIAAITTIIADEPRIESPPPRSLKESVIGPLADFFARTGAWEILLFIILYKLGDTMAGAMATPFYLQLGFTKTDIGTIAKTFGLFSALAGGFVGGLLIIKLSISRSLFFFGILQALSTFGFSILAAIGMDRLALTAVIVFEDFTAGMGSAAFMAFMAMQTNKRFTATQYALLTSLMGIPRIFIAAPTGYLVEGLGWRTYFIFCTLIAIPGLLLVFRIAPWKKSPQSAA
jgi:MFS transporter, PAT family, beta-lactamase induction signal transducer AmpG